MVSRILFFAKTERNVFAETAHTAEMSTKKTERHGQEGNVVTPAKAHDGTKFPFSLAYVNAGRANAKQEPLTLAQYKASHDRVPAKFPAMPVSMTHEIAWDDSSVITRAISAVMTDVIAYDITYVVSSVIACDVT